MTDFKKFNETLAFAESVDAVSASFDLKDIKQLKEERDKMTEMKIEIDRLEHKLSCVISHATGALLSKPTYDLDTVYEAIDDFVDRKIVREIKSAWARAHGDNYKQYLEPLLKEIGR